MADVAHQELVRAEAAGHHAEAEVGDLPVGHVLGERGRQVFGYEVLTTAILDRLLHHCEVISINGPSYRLKNRLKTIERENDVA
ncbi:hypothetical protein GCM10010302_17370 [Streptomyces polychromogenes]|uniref:IstB-like ATP-binding domain-containing protein n=1 Tax=Streptomyces polychromogenes TaxID=67342 RepID=A0ABP3EYN6_9ACTN